MNTRALSRTSLLWILVGALSVFALSACEPKKENVAASKAPKRAPVHNVEKEDALTVQTYPGRAEARQSVALSFRVGGPLLELPVKEGDTVDKNQLLARLDPRDYKLRIRGIQAEISAARAQRKQAQQDVNRTQNLVQNQAAAGAQLERVETGLNISSAMLQGGQSALKGARSALQDTQLRAPFKGRVASLKVENHQTVGPGMPIVQLQDLSAFHIKIFVPERDMFSLTSEQDPELKVHFEVSPNTVYKATIAEYGTAIDKQTQSYPVTLEVTVDPEAGILPGMAATASWTRTGKSHRIVVPLSAVQTTPEGKTRLWKVDPQTKTLQASMVTLGQVHDHGVEILQGVAPGDMILSKGTRSAQEGMLVEPIELNKQARR